MAHGHIETEGVFPGAGGGGLKEDIPGTLTLSQRGRS